MPKHPTLSRSERVQAAEVLVRNGWEADRIALLLGVTTRSVHYWLSSNAKRAKSIRKSYRSFVEQARALGE